MKTSSITQCVAFVAALALQPIASAMDGTWTDATQSTSWSTTNSWVNGVVASGQGATATFANSANSTRVNQNVSGLTIGSMRVLSQLP